MLVLAFVTEQSDTHTAGLLIFLPVVDFLTVWQVFSYFEFTLIALNSTSIWLRRCWSDLRWLLRKLTESMQ